MQQLPQYDADLTKKRQEAENAGEVSIYKICLLVYLLLRNFLLNLPVFLGIRNIGLMSILSFCDVFD